MRKKGFTLIELLAVIVILAVIALIATPLIMGTITKAKKNAAIDSAYGYLRALTVSIGEVHVKNKEQLLEQESITFTISDEGKTLSSDGITLTVHYKGSSPEDGSTLTLQKGGSISGTLKINGYDIQIKNDKAVIAE